MNNKKSSWFVYMVKCKDGSIYTGISNDVEDRIKEHNSGQGGKYTASKRPVRLIFQEEQTDKSSALKRERQIKNWGRVKKEALSRFGSARSDSLALSPPRAEPKGEVERLALSLSKGQSEQAYHE